MKKLLVVLVPITFLLSSKSLSAKQIDFEAEFTRVEKFYLKGDYKNGLPKAQSLLKKVEKQKGESDLWKAKALTLVARFYEGLGKYDDFSKNMDLVIKIIQPSSKEDLRLLASVYSDVAFAYYQYGEYLKAQEYIELAAGYIGDGKIKDGNLMTEIYLNQAKIFLKQYYTLKAEKVMAFEIPVAKARIVKREQVVTDGKSEFRSLSKSERTARIRIASEMMNLYSLILIENGNYSKADSQLIRNKEFIKKNLGKKDVAYAENMYQNALLLELRNKKGESNRLFDKAGKRSLNTKHIRWKPTCKEAIPFQEKRILSHRMANRDHQAKKRKKILETRIVRYYKKNSPYYAKILLLEGENYLIEKDYKRAAERAMSVINNPSYFPAAHPERIRALKLLYNAALNTDQYPRAEGALEQIIDIRKKLNGEQAPAYALAMLDLANFDVLYSDKFKRAEETYSSGLKKVEGEIDHRYRNYSDYIYNYVTLFEYTDRFEKALEQTKKELEDAKKYYGEKDIEYARALSETANIFIDLGRYSEAEKNLETAYEVFKSEGTSNDNEKYSEVLKTYARLYIIQGQYDEARRLIRKSINKQSGSSEQVKVTEAFEELATLNIETGKYQETEKNLKEAIKIREEKYGVNHRTLINPLNQLSHLNLITGNFTDAEKLAKRSATISMNIFGNSSIKFSEALKLLGSVYAAIGDYEKAEDAVTKALEIQKHQYGEAHLQIAITLNELALIKFYNQAAKDKVEGLFNEALAIAKSTVGEKHPTYASILYNLGLFYYETGDLSKAESDLNLADITWKDKLGSNNIHSAEVNLMKGNLAYKKGNYSEAKVSYVASKNIYEKIFDNTHPGYLSALGKAGQMDYINGDYKEAVRSLNETTTSYLTYIKKYFPSLSEREKTKFWNKIQKDFEFYNTLAVKLKDQNPELIGNVYNYTLATKALMLNSSIKVRQRILESNDPVLIQKFEEWMDKKEFLTSAISMTAEQRKENEIDIKVLESEIEALEKDLSDRSEVFAKNFRKKENYEWKDVKKSLEENEAAVEIVRFRWFGKSFTDTIVYAALVVSPEKSSPELVVFANGKQMEEKGLKYYKNCMKYGVEDKQSYNQFWKPIKEKIPGNDRIYFSAEGVFNQINIETIPVGDNLYVIDQNEIVLVSNTRDLIQAKQEETARKNKKSEASINSTTNKIALFGNPLYYSNQVVQDTMAIDSLLTRGGNGNNEKRINQLPGAEQEVKELQNLLQSSGWKPEAYVNGEATERRIKELNNIRVFHIATHGFFLEDKAENLNDEGLNQNRAIENPLLKSGLLLADGGSLLEKENVYEFNSSDGILTAYEAMNLNFDNCDLVVLSACETGLGKVQLGEGVFGLQRAFLVAGARTVVMSLFKVNDEVTQELMNLFYQNWIRTGDKRKAFIEAKKSIKEKYKNPIYWGAFVMVGVG